MADSSSQEIPSATRAPAPRAVEITGASLPIAWYQRTTLRQSAVVGLALLFCVGLAQLSVELAGACGVALSLVWFVLSLLTSRTRVGRDGVSIAWFSSSRFHRWADVVDVRTDDRVPGVLLVMADGKEHLLAMPSMLRMNNRPTKQALQARDELLGHIIAARAAFQDGLREAERDRAVEKVAMYVAAQHGSPEDHATRDEAYRSPAIDREELERTLANVHAPRPLRATAARLLRVDGDDSSRRRISEACHASADPQLRAALTSIENESGEGDDAVVERLRSQR